MKTPIIFFSLALISGAAMDARSVAYKEKAPAPRSSSVEVLSGSLDDILKKNSVVVLYFCATWCGPCKELLPFLQDLAQANPNTKFVKIDIKERKAIADKYRVKSVPTLVLIKNGNEVKRSVGFNRRNLNSFLD